MPHVTHLQGNRFSIGARRGSMSREIQTSLQSFQRALTQKRGDILVQDESREHALNAGHARGYISSVTNFSSAAITKFERRMGLIGSHRGTTKAN